MWQKCPICDGTGIKLEPYIQTEVIKCPTCNGKRILNERTGLPPDYELHGKLRENEDIPHNLGDEDAHEAWKIIKDSMKF
jgi:DNA-directed RNA polymerase subunit RPC12/RpoP